MRDLVMMFDKGYILFTDTCDVFKISFFDQF